MFGRVGSISGSRSERWGREAEASKAKISVSVGKVWIKVRAGRTKLVSRASALVFRRRVRVSGFRTYVTALKIVDLVRIEGGSVVVAISTVKSAK